MKRLAVESYTTRAHNSPYYVYMFTCDCMIYICYHIIIINNQENEKNYPAFKLIYEQDANQSGKAAEIHRTMKSTPEVWFQGGPLRGGVAEHQQSVVSSTPFRIKLFQGKIQGTNRLNSAGCDCLDLS